MLAHCAKTVEEEMVPAVAPPAARARDEGSSKALTPGGQDNGSFSQHSLLLLIPFYNLPVLNNGISQRMRLLRNIETYVMVTLLREADGYPVDVRDTDNSLLTAIH